MPIVGGSATLGTTTLGFNTFFPSYNASEYSHSTVFVTSATDESSFLHMNAPPLMTIYTPPTTCVDRWMLAGGQVVTTTRRLPTAQVAVTAATSSTATITAVLPVEPSGKTSALEELTTMPSNPLITSSAVLLPRDFVAQNFTVMSLDLNGTATDPSYRKCQPYGLAPTYSPGICPFGHTVAEVTAWQVNASTGYRTFWQASCCRSGMTFGPEFYEACISTFSTTLQALALLTATTAIGATPTTSYEFTTSIYDTSARTWSESKINSTTVLSTGLAVADPIVIAWQMDDFKLFPSDYATSLARKIGVSLPTNTAAGPQQPDTVPSELSIGAKAGIGVGAAIGALVVTTAVVLLCLRRRRQTGNQTATSEHAIPEMADTDQDVAKKKWWAGGKWRSEADAQAEQQELDSKTVHVVPGPPAELDGAELHHPHETGRAVLR